jgi:hypothetical protein
MEYAMIYILRFINIGSGIQNLRWGYTDGKMIS